jgi:hypothetical protein
VPVAHSTWWWRPKRRTCADAVASGVGDGSIARFRPGTNGYDARWAPVPAAPPRRNRHPVQRSQTRPLVISVPIGEPLSRGIVQPARAEEMRGRAEGKRAAAGKAVEPRSCMHDSCHSIYRRQGHSTSAAQKLTK